MKSSKFTSTPLFPRQALVALLLPLIAEQALSVTIGLADTLMVSSVGEAAVSGVSLVDSFNTLMIQIMSALATGGAVVTSQYIGHQEPKNAKAAAAQILFVLSSFSVLVAAVVIVIIMAYAVPTFSATFASLDLELPLATRMVIAVSDFFGRYGWLVGAFGFYRHRSMQAPVLFKEDGLEHLIADKAEQYTGLRPHFASDRMALDSDFRNPAWGAALYHESQLRLGRFDLSAGLRIDYERTRLCYLSSTDIDCTFGDGRITPFTERGTLHKSFVQLLPKAAAVYRIDDGNSLYASVAKGYKAGGFNTQMFSEVLQNSVMERMGVYWNRHYDIDRVVAYKPEKSWNFEVGSHFAFADGRIRGEATLFYILCRDQQLTVFPEGQTTGRMMTNAGRTRSRGGELSVQALVAHRLDLRLSYGFTHATFAEFRSGNADYAGKRIPYAPRHTAAAVAEYTVSVGRSWLDGIVLSVDGRGVGPIEWNEANSLRQKFYALAGCAIRFEQRHGSLSLWCRNLTQTRYDVFYFESIGNAFLQRGRPREWGVTLTINLQHNER